jgi:hypothetical protein
MSFKTYGGPSVKLRSRPKIARTLASAFGFGFGFGFAGRASGFLKLLSLLNVNEIGHLLFFSISIR